jgi:hypothetical protein
VKTLAKRALGEPGAQGLLVRKNMKHLIEFQFIFMNEIGT